VKPKAVCYPAERTIEQRTWVIQKKKEGKEGGIEEEGDSVCAISENEFPPVTDTEWCCRREGDLEGDKRVRNKPEENCATRGAPKATSVGERKGDRSNAKKESREDSGVSAWGGKSVSRVS